MSAGWWSFTISVIMMFMQVFKELFDAVIDEKHLGFGPNDTQPAPDLDANKVCIFFAKEDSCNCLLKN